MLNVNFVKQTQKYVMVLQKTVFVFLQMILVVKRKKAMGTIL